MLRTEAGMVAVRMRDNCAIHRFPRIDKKISGWTVKSFICKLYERHA
jgi:hypothetical protein